MKQSIIVDDRFKIGQYLLGSVLIGFDTDLLFLFVNLHSKIYQL